MVSTFEVIVLSFIGNDSDIQGYSCSFIGYDDLTKSFLGMQVGFAQLLTNFLRSLFGNHSHIKMQLCGVVAFRESGRT